MNRRWIHEYAKVLAEVSRITDPQKAEELARGLTRDWISLAVYEDLSPNMLRACEALGIVGKTHLIAYIRNEVPEGETPCPNAERGCYGHMVHGLPVEVPGMAPHWHCWKCGAEAPHGTA